jgi:hypothetical protein
MRNAPPTFPVFSSKASNSESTTREGHKITGVHATVDRFPDRGHERPRQVGELGLNGEHPEPAGEGPAGVGIRLGHSSQRGLGINSPSIAWRVPGAASPKCVQWGIFPSTALSPVNEVLGRILVVDDEPMVRARITRVLTDEGYEVVSVADGQAALDIVRNADVPFDLVITNILHVERPAPYEQRPPRPRSQRTILRAPVGQPRPSTARQRAAARGQPRP